MTDILERLKSWHVQLVIDAPHRKGEFPEVEIELVQGTINEIESLRSTIRVLRSSQSLVVDRPIRLTVPVSRIAYGSANGAAHRLAPTFGEGRDRLHTRGPQ